MRRKTRIGPSWLGLLVLLALLLAACSSPAPNFNIALSPTSLTVQQGTSGNTTLTLTPQNGFTGTVTLSLVDAGTNNPVPGITLSPPSFTVSTSSPTNQTLTVNVDSSVATGSYSLKVKAVSGSLNKEASLSLTVNSLLGSTWTQLGSELNISSSQDAESPSLALDASGNPVVAWHENTPGQFDNIYVKRWDGTDWVPLGNALDISEPQPAERPSLALDASGRPAVAWFENDGTSNNIYVKRWDGASWLLQGSGLDTVLSQEAQHPKVAMDSLGYPVVVWQEQVGSAKRIYVKRRLP